MSNKRQVAHFLSFSRYWKCPVRVDRRLSWENCKILSYTIDALGIVTVHRSRLTHQLASLSLLPFPVPFCCRCIPVWRRLTSRYSIHPHLPQAPGVVCRHCASPSSPHSSLCHHTTPFRMAATHWGLSGAGTWMDGGVEIGGRPSKRQRSARWSLAFVCT